MTAIYGVIASEAKQSRWEAIRQRRGEYPMTEGKNRQWILNARPAGKLTGEEFLWNEAPVPRPSDGQVLIRTLWLSVDPAQRIWMARDSYKPAVPLGNVMQSFAVGQVIESRDPDFKPGDSCAAISVGRTTW
jgi:NADPH-dependent curcumin reductase CurA